MSNGKEPWGSALQAGAELLLQFLERFRDRPFRGSKWRISPGHGHGRGHSPLPKEGRHTHCAVGRWSKGCYKVSQGEEKGLVDSCIYGKEQNNADLSCTTGMDYFFEDKKGWPNGAEVWPSLSNEEMPNLEGEFRVNNKCNQKFDTWLPISLCMERQSYLNHISLGFFSEIWAG